jgi:hypothetical protein
MISNFCLCLLLSLGTQSPKQNQGHHAGMDSQLRVSIDSFAAYITDHFSPTKGMPRVKGYIIPNLDLVNVC